MSYLGLQILYYHRTQDFILEFILMGMTALSLATTIPRFQWLMRLVLLEFYSFLYIFFVSDLYYKPHKYIPLGLATSGAMLLTLFGFLVYPYLLRAYIAFTGSVVPTITSQSREATGNTVRLEITQKGFWNNVVNCVYQGSIKAGKPDGHGVWIDTSPQGEFLQGYWQEGVPIGPFESMENGTRSMLSNLRIIYGTNAGGKFWLERY